MTTYDAYESINETETPGQRTIYGTNLEQERNGPFGDSNNKQDGSIRITVQNIHRIPEHRSSAKSLEMINTLEKWKIDVWGLTETNIVWHNIKKSNCWPERMKKYRGAQSNFAYNQHIEISEKFIPGGVGQISHPNLAGRIIGHGRDESGLGRWVWQKFQGKYGYDLRIITYYRPCYGETQDV